MRRIFSLMIVLVIILGLTVTTHATLWDRGGGLIYDTDLNITWLQDANYANTSGYAPNGAMTWGQAMTWAENLVYGGYSDWRLPTALNRDGSGPDFGYGVTGSEMGHLYYTELGNGNGGPLTNTGPFTNLQPYNRWSGTEVYGGPSMAWSFYFNNGFQGNASKELNLINAWPVRDGDVSTVPEPSTMILLGSGLVGLIGFRRKLRK